MQKTKIDKIELEKSISKKKIGKKCCKKIDNKINQCDTIFGIARKECGHYEDNFKKKFNFGINNFEKKFEKMLKKIC